MPKQEGFDRGQPRSQKLHEGRAAKKVYSKSINRGYKTTVPKDAVPPKPTPTPKSPLDKK
jgi:hypothetical protein